MRESVFRGVVRRRRTWSDAAAGLSRRLVPVLMQRVIVHAAGTERHCFPLLPKTSRSTHNGSPIRLGMRSYYVTSAKEHVFGC